MEPKVFISHASEDKERFVIEFATKLRRNGVNAWLDKWEMLPGDSLVDKIFEEGLKEAHAIIIVLSNSSVKKPWVHEELNASVVKKISKGTKIIPVILDACDVPESLSSTLWEPIKDLSNYNDSFNRILSSIFGLTDKPPLGVPPKNTLIDYKEINGITKIDNMFLKLSCEEAMRTNEAMLSPSDIIDSQDELTFTEQQINDSLEILEKNNCINVSWYISGDCNYKITNYGFDLYAKAYLPTYPSIMNELISLIVNKNILSNTELQSETKGSIYLINHILELLESKDYISLIKYMDGSIDIEHVSAGLRRSLD